MTRISTPLIESRAVPPYNPPSVDDTLLDVIWNVTQLCGWNCAICCVSALEVKRSKDLVYISTPELDGYEVLQRDESQGTIFDQALKYRQASGSELTLEQKFVVLDHLAGHRVRLDLSGGDVLSPSENCALLDEAARRLGRENITLTATGAGLAHYDIPSIRDRISELNFTFDGTPDPDNQLRPMSYASGNLRRARQFADAGVAVRAECPLSAQNVDPENLTQIYRSLHDAGVSRLLLMRLFSSGRGVLRNEDIPTPDQYRRAIDTLRELESRYGSPSLKLQCALRHFETPTTTNPCDAFTESFGLMWDGTLLGSPWAISKSGRPVDDAWVLGNLKDDTLTAILESDKVKSARARANANHGHCKFIAWENGTSSTSSERMFELSDPLYVSSPSGAS